MPRRLACLLALACCEPPVPQDSPAPAAARPVPQDIPAPPVPSDSVAAARDACLAAHADAPARYVGLVRAFCSEHAHLGGVGASLAVAEAGALRYTATTGLRCVHGDPVTPDTPFRVGSLTKLLTAALALDRANHDLLDAPLPELADHPDPRARAITTRQLLHHTSGLPDLDPRAAADTPWRAALAARPLWAAPDALWSYSNAGYALVGAALERGAGEPYPALLARRILDPLRLTRTTADRDRALQMHAACGHLGRGPDAVPLDVRQDLELGAAGAAWTIPAGGLIASASDLLDLVLALHDPARSPLSADARRALFAAGPLTHERPRERQAPGLRAEPLPDGGLLHRLSGRTGDFTADLSFAPDHGFALVVLTNTGDPLRATLAAAHADLLGLRPTAGPPAPAAAYAGQYELPDRTTILVDDDLTLTAPSLGLDRTPLAHTGDHRFHAAAPAHAVTFVFTAGPDHATHLRARGFVAGRVKTRRGSPARPSG